MSRRPGESCDSGSGSFTPQSSHTSGEVQINSPSMCGCVCVVCVLCVVCVFGCGVCKVCLGVVCVRVETGNFRQGIPEDAEGLGWVSIMDIIMHDCHSLERSELPVVMVTEVVPQFVLMCPMKTIAG